MLNDTDPHNESRHVHLRRPRESGQTAKKYPVLLIGLQRRRNRGTNGGARLRNAETARRRKCLFRLRINMLEVY